MRAQNAATVAPKAMSAAGVGAWPMAAPTPAATAIQNSAGNNATISRPTN